MNQVLDIGDRRGLVTQGNAVDVSIIIPMMNEAENVEPLMAEILAALRGHERFEVVAVDDGSTDGTDRVLEAMKRANPELRIIRHSENCGQSAALRTGILAARGPLAVTLDGDGQNDPADIPRLIATFRARSSPALGMVMGQRVKRQDTLAKKLASRLANRIRQALLADGTADVGCSLKAIDRERFLRLPYFDHMHRYLPALMQREGFEVAFVTVNHRPRLHGRSKYGIFDRLWVSISDVLGVMWLKRRCRRPSSRIEL